MHRHSSANSKANCVKKGNFENEICVNDDSVFQQFFDTEQLVRLENARRACKARLNLIDEMMNEVDEQLMYVSQFKYQWLKYKKELEEHRQSLMRKESDERENDVVQAEAKEWRQITLRSALLDHSFQG